MTHRLEFELTSPLLSARDSGKEAKCLNHTNVKYRESWLCASFNGNCQNTQRLRGCTQKGFSRFCLQPAAIHIWWLLYLLHVSDGSMIIVSLQVQLLCNQLCSLILSLRCSLSRRFAPDSPLFCGCSLVQWWLMLVVAAQKLWESEECSEIHPFIYCLTRSAPQHCSTGAAKLFTQNSKRPQQAYFGTVEEIREPRKTQTRCISIMSANASISQ